MDSKEVGRRGNGDGNPLTGYDFGVKTHNDSIFSYNEIYHTLSFSVGANYLIDDSKAIFARISKGNKAPDHEWYISNFENNVPIGRGTVEKIYQAEVGYKIRKPKYSLFATAFYSFWMTLPIKHLLREESHIFHSTHFQRIENDWVGD